MPWYDHLQGTYHKLQGSHRLNKIGMPMFPAAFTDSQLSPTARFASKSTSFPSSSSQLAQEPFILYRNQWMASSAPMPILSNGMECLQHRLFSGDVYTQLFNKMSSKGYPFEPYRRDQIDHIFWSTPPITMILVPPASPWAPLSITSIIKAKYISSFNRLNSRGVLKANSKRKLRAN